MDLIDIPLMIAFVIVFDTIIISILLKLTLRKYGLDKVAPLAKQYMSHLGKQSQANQGDKRLKVQNTQAKRAIAEGIFDDLPLGGTIKKALIRRNVPPEALFGLLQDKEFMAGVEVIAKGFGVATGKLSEMMHKKEQEEPKQQRRNEPQQFGQLAL